MQIVDEIWPLLLVEVDNHLRVRAGGELVPTTFKVAPKFKVVVDLAIQYNRHRPVLVGDGLISGDEVDYAQTLNPQANAWGNVGTSGVRSAVLNGSAHAMKERGSYLLASGARLSCDAAHGLPQ
jgi:hypothetical protein